MRLNILDEKASVDRLVRRLSFADQEKWDAGHSVHRFLCYEGKRLRIYTLQGLEPNTLSVITCRSITFDTKTGFTSAWVDEHDFRTEVGHVPQSMEEGVFLWHPLISEVQLRQYTWGNSASVPVKYKQHHNPLHHRYDGVVYILEDTVFKTTFPGA